MGRLRHVMQCRVHEGADDGQLLVGTERQARIQRYVEHGLALGHQKRVAELHLRRNDGDEAFSRRSPLKLREERLQIGGASGRLRNVALLRVQEQAVLVGEVQGHAHRLGNGHRRGARRRRDDGRRSGSDAQKRARDALGESRQIAAIGEDEGRDCGRQHREEDRGGAPAHVVAVRPLMSRRCAVLMAPVWGSAWGGPRPATAGRRSA